MYSMTLLYFVKNDSKNCVFGVNLHMAYIMYVIHCLLTKTRMGILSTNRNGLFTMDLSQNKTFFQCMTIRSTVHFIIPQAT